MPIETVNPLDTLKTLNIMASYIGIPPIKNLTQVDTEPDFDLASKILEEVTYTTLSQGLPCNTDYEFPLTEVNGDGYLIVPDGALIVDVITAGFVIRDGLIYDQRARDFTTLTNLKADITWNMNYDALPELVKRYIAINSSRTFVTRIKGDAAGQQLTIPDERRVKQEFQRYVYNTGDLTILSGELPYQISRSGRNHFRKRF